MNSGLDQLIHSEGFEARLDDMRILLDLEAKCLSNKRLTVRQVITLQTLREFYPGSSARIRSELLMGDESHEELLLFVVNKEDTELYIGQDNAEGDNLGPGDVAASGKARKHGNPDLEP
ncbi:hypothetical protein [Pseudosulfitobacter pseudonitzschiae]|uniref:hypothetical protein n=1 Tax=Pseudosulfitobacter pseudonitzschiae TaxID=1402135 RepID=UPI003B79886B